MKGKKFLVTGGAGFIGSNLVEKLVENNDIVVVDNLHTGSLENLKEFKNKVEFINKSCGEITLEDIEEIDGIFHIGIYSSSPMYKEDRSLVGKAINDFLNILELARRENCKIVFASSSSIYNGNPIPWREDMEIKVTDFYTEARYSMERLADLYHQLYGIESIGLRFFSVYGPKEKYKGKYANLVSQFLWAMEKDEIPVIYGDGEQRRDLTYVKDIVDACILAMKSDKIGAFNVGTGKDYSLNELIDILNNVLGKDIKPKYIENPIKNYVQNTRADTEKAKKELEFEHKYSLKEGIEKLISEKT